MSLESAPVANSIERQDTEPTKVDSVIRATREATVEKKELEGLNAEIQKEKRDSRPASRLKSMTEIKEYNQLRKQEREWLNAERRRIRKEGIVREREARKISIDEYRRVVSEINQEKAQLDEAHRRLQDSQKQGISAYRQALSKEMR